MSSYHGFLSYPHGGRVSGMLLITMAGAVVCTCYSVTSCRFVTLDYESKYGDFDNHFYERNAEDALKRYTVGVGLFTWLRPFDTLDWSNGHCAGYTELMREEIVDEMFDVLRILGVISVLMSISLFLFSLFVACLAFNNIQRYMIVITSIVAASLTGSVFLIKRSALCTQVGENSNCSMDQGGLAAIAGIILWVLTSMAGTFFLQPVSPQKRKKSSKARTKERIERRKQQLAILHDLDRMETEIYLQRQSEQSSISTNPNSSPSRTQSPAGSSQGSPRRSPSSKTPQNSPPRLKERSSPGSPKTTPKRTSSKSNNGSTENRSRIRSDIEAVANMVQKRRQPEDEEVEVAMRSSLSAAENSVKEFEAAASRGGKIKRNERKNLEDNDNYESLEEELERVAREAGLSEPIDEEMPSSNRASKRRRRNTAREYLQLSLVQNDQQQKESSLGPSVALTRDLSSVVDEQAIQDSGLEVYISKTLDNIDSLIDEENPHNDPYWYEI